MTFNTYGSAVKLWLSEYGLTLHTTRSRIVGHSRDESFYAVGCTGMTVKHTELKIVNKLTNIIFFVTDISVVQRLWPYSDCCGIFTSRSGTGSARF